MLTDPVLRGRVGHLRRHAALPPVAAPDLVVISHLHHDHLDVPSLRGLPGEPLVVVPPGAGAWLRGQGVARVRELAVGDELVAAGVRVAAVPAEHDGRRMPVGGPAAPAQGYVVAGAGTRVWFAGDTGLFDGMAALADRRLDVALVPIWGWGPTLGPGHLDPREAARAVALARPRLAVPIHWGTLLPLGTRRHLGHLLRDPAERFAAAMAELAPGIGVAVVAPGGTLALDGA